MNGCPRVGSLFSGIGGLDAGLARAGWEHVFLCESDPWRRDVLRARFPGVTVYDDVRDVGQGAEGARSGRLRALGGDDDIADPGRRWAHAANGDVDLLCGGFPCQDLSVAGQRRGLAGDRSGLFHEFARVADALRPRWLLVENVPGLLSSNGGRDFGVVLGTLADIGYGLGWRVLDSRYFGVPQRRRRVFIVGALAVGDPAAAAERAGEVLAVGSRCARHPATRGEAGPDVAVASLSGLGNGGPDDNDGQAGRLVAAALTSPSNGRGGSYRLDDHDVHGNHLVTRREDDYNLVAGPLGGGNDGIGRRSEDDPNLVAHALTSAGADASEDGTGRGTPLIAATAAVRRLTPTECERLQGLPDGWTNPDGTAPDSRRYAGLGDAVTATVGEWIGRQLLQYAKARAAA